MINLTWFMSFSQRYVDYLTIEPQLQLQAKLPIHIWRPIDSTLASECINCGLKATLALRENRRYDQEWNRCEK